MVRFANRRHSAPGLVYVSCEISRTGLRCLFARSINAPGHQSLWQLNPKFNDTTPVDGSNRTPMQSKDFFGSHPHNHVSFSIDFALTFTDRAFPALTDQARCDKAGLLGPLLILLLKQHTT